MNVIEKAITCLKEGKMIMISDDESRENECDLVCSGENITNEQMSFIIRYTGGIVCVPIEKTLSETLNFFPMIDKNTDRHGTSFTVSVDYLKGTTTGISSGDRTKTIRAIASDRSLPSDYQKPGHVFPLICNSKGLKERRGHTEASIEMMKLSGLKPISVISELLNDDGSIMTGERLLTFANDNSLIIITVQQIVDYINS